MPDRVVFDTNIWISGLVWRGKPYQCLLMARAGLVEVFYCAPILAELTEKLRDKFGFSENHIHAVAYNVRNTATAVEIAGNLHAVSADPDDDKFVECAVVAGASFIVSGDRHLLNLGCFGNIKVLTAADLVARYAAGENVAAQRD